MTIEIKELSADEIPAYAALIKEVYAEFVAADYPEEGNRTFYDFIDQRNIRTRLGNGNLMVCAKVDGDIVGAHEIRDGNHIALFFVKTSFHHKGIGRMMFDYSLRHVLQHSPDARVITVNSSPYAVPVYRGLGFAAVSPMQTRDGISFYPMEYGIK